MYCLRTILLLLVFAVGFIPALQAAPPLTLHQQDSEPAPTARLYPNYPNPFGGTTTLRYALSGEATVRLAVYDVLGRTVRVLIDAPRAGGEHATTWDARDEAGQPVAPGLYLYRLEVGQQRHVRKMVVVR